MDRYDELQRLIQERAEEERKQAALYGAWVELLQAYQESYGPTEGDPNQWSHAEVLIALRHMTRLLREKEDRGTLPAFGKGDFPVPQNFKPIDGIDET